MLKKFNKRSPPFLPIQAPSIDNSRYDNCKYNIFLAQNYKYFKPIWSSLNIKEINIITSTFDYQIVYHLTNYYIFTNL